MDKARDKGQPGSKGKGQARRKVLNRKPRAGGKHLPGVLSSWEEWDEDAMRLFLQDVIAQIEADLDEQERAMRCQN